MNPPPETFNFLLSMHGLGIMVFHGANKRQPSEVDILLVNTEAGAESGHAEHTGHAGHTEDPGHRHFAFLSFSPLNLAAGSSTNYRLVPSPDGSQIGLASLAGLVTVENDPEESNPPAGLTAVWRPAIEPDRELPSETETSEQEWLNWVPSLQKVNPGVQAPTDDFPFAGLRDDLVVARIRLRAGRLRAADIVKNPDGHFIPWAFKPPVGAAIATQALANSVVLEFRDLTKPVWIETRSGRFGLVAKQPGVTITASLTHLPDEELRPSDRLTHFAMYYGLADFAPRPTDLNLPEKPHITDTSTGSVCTFAVYTKVPPCNP